MTRFGVLVLTVGILGGRLTPYDDARAAQQESADDRVKIDDVPADVFSGSREKDMLRVQVLLNQARFSPGVIDGLGGGNTTKAIKAFKRAKGLNGGGNIDKKLLSKLSEGGDDVILRRYKISKDDVKGPFADSIPKGLEKQAELDGLDYTSPQEMLSEKFHVDMDFLKKLNPKADFAKAGTEIIVPARRSDGIESKVVRIEVDKELNAVRAYGDKDELLAFYPATVGSKSLPSPEGSMEVKAVATNAAYYFNPEDMSWGPDKSLEIPPGPNNPVGSTWIDLSKESYGIHGSPDPELISKTASHGCVRLTNWDVEELADAVSKGVKVKFTGG